MKEQFTINQHYISEIILEHFSNHKQQVFETLVNKGEIFTSKIRNSMSETYFYEHPLLKKNNLEKEFSKIEADFDFDIKKIVNMLDIYESDESIFGKIKSLVEKNIEIFIIFYYKSGALLYEFDHLSVIKEQKINLLLEKILDSSYIKALSETIKCNYKFSIIKCENNNFLLSDQYISTVALGVKSRFTNISNRHMGLKNVLILIPISSKYYLVYYEGNKPYYIKENSINKLEDDQVKEINEVIINNSYVKCIGKNKEALNDAILKFEFSSPSSTFGGSDYGTVMGATNKKEVFFYKSDLKTWNILTSAYRWSDYIDLNRNDKCVCKSGKKYKNCCKDSFEEFIVILKSFGEVGKSFPFTDDHTAFKVNQNSVIEKSIMEFYSNRN